MPRLFYCAEWLVFALGRTWYIFPLLRNAEYGWHK